ncbi:hypothetical protein CATMIT_01783, partial [Catenibacterium mitsuokai DSM 15897]
PARDTAPPAQVAAHHRLGLAREVLHETVELGDLGEQAAARLARTQIGHQRALHVRREGQHMQIALGVAQRLADDRPEPLAHAFGQVLGRLGGLAGVDQHLQDRLEVADRHLLAQQQLQHALDVGIAQHRRHQLFEQRGVLIAHALQQAFGVGAGQQVGGLAFDQFAQVGHQHRVRID